MRDLNDPVARKIGEHGWAVVNVEGDESEPGYAYSVGLYESFAHPEVIVFGLAPAVLRQIINVIGAEIRQGLRFSDTDTTNRVLTGYECAFRSVAPAAEDAYMGAVIDYYDGEVPALHCIWPDSAGRFPWDQGASADYRRLQPMLSEGPEPYSHTRPRE